MQRRTLTALNRAAKRPSNSLAVSRTVITHDHVRVTHYENRSYPDEATLRGAGYSENASCSTTTSGGLPSVTMTTSNLQIGYFENRAAR